MNRSTRTLLVLGVALVTASLASFLVYRTIKNLPVRQVEVAQAYAVVAARSLPVGALLAPADVKLIPWPVANQVPGGFTKIEDVAGRGVIAAVVENEPLTANNIAAPGAGAGLPPTIPPGMRAISVKVNEVIGVAGFVVPGTRVDVMVIVDQGAGGIARVVVSNVQVLAAGTKFDQESAKEGTAMPSSVVTLMVSPDDAERVALATAQGQIMLTLRNPLDAQQTESTGTRIGSLIGAPAPAPAPRGPVAPRRVAAPAPAAAPAPPPVYRVETIRAAKRTEETVK